MSIDNPMDVESRHLGVKSFRFFYFINSDTMDFYFPCARSDIVKTAPPRTSYSLSGIPFN